MKVSQVETLVNEEGLFWKGFSNLGQLLYYDLFGALWIRPIPSDKRMGSSAVHLSSKYKYKTQ